MPKRVKNSVHPAGCPPCPTLTRAAPSTYESEVRSEAYSVREAAPTMCSSCQRGVDHTYVVPRGASEVLA